MDQNMTEYSGFKRYFAAMIALYPLLGMYGIFISGLSWADILILGGFLFYIILKKQIYLYPSTNGWLLYYLFSLITLFIVENTGIIAYPMGVLTRYLKFGYLIVVASFIIPGDTDSDYFWKTLRVLCNLIIIGFIIQYTVYYGFHQYIELKIPFLQYYSSALENGADLEKMYMGMSVFRPNSILLEPSSCAYSFLPLVIHYLFKEKQTTSDLKYAFLYTGGMLMSISSTGMIFAIVLWTFYMIAFMTGKRLEVYGQQRANIFILMILVLATLVFVVLRTSLADSATRLMNYSDKYRGAWERVFAGEGLRDSLNGIYKWVGMGLGNYFGYVNSINFILYCTGYIGMTIICVFFIVLFLKCKTEGRIALIVLTGLMFSSPIIFSGNLLSFICIISWNYRINMGVRTRV